MPGELEKIKPDVRKLVKIPEAYPDTTIRNVFVFTDGRRITSYRIVEIKVIRNEKGRLVGGQYLGNRDFTLDEVARLG